MAEPPSKEAAEKDSEAELEIVLEDGPRRHSTIGDYTGFEEFKQTEDQAEWQQKLAVVLNSLPLAVLVLVLILVDCILAIVSLASDYNDGSSSAKTIQGITIFVLSILLLEIIARILAMGAKFFMSPWNVVDVVVMACSLLFTILSFTAGKFVVVLRIMRVARVGLYFRRQREQVPTRARQYVSANRRRLQDDGFDLDITFISSRVAAMSWPSTGKEALYRNPIGEVARYFDTKYTNRYWVYNLCAEREYDYTKFHNRVTRFPMRDHNPCPLSRILDFCKAAEAFLGEDSANIVVIHCKGGKGRTGTMVASFFLYTNAFETATQALEFFATQRTADDGEREGVEEPSQERYVGYFGQLVAAAAKEKGPVAIPPGDKLFISVIRVYCMTPVINMIKEENKTEQEGFVGDLAASGGQGVWVRIAVAEKTVFDQRPPDAPYQVPVAECFEYHAAEDMYEFTLPNVEVVGDFNVSFVRNHPKPGKEPKHVFGFWEHTEWLAKKEAPLLLKRTQVDGAHKPKNWKKYTENFRVEVHFSPEPSAMAVA